MSTPQVPRIGIVIGSTREGRFSEKPARWIHGIGIERADLAVELVDLRDYPLPFCRRFGRRPRTRSPNGGPPSWPRSTG